MLQSGPPADPCLVRLYAQACLPGEKIPFCQWCSCLRKYLHCNHDRAHCSQTKRVPTGQTQLSFQNRLHVRALQWKPSEDLSRCIMEGRGDRWSSEGVGCFRTSAVTADVQIVEQHDFDFGSVRH